MKLNDCVCRSIEHRNRTRPLVVLTSREHLRDMSNSVAATLPAGSSCYGASWVDPKGRMVCVKSYLDQVPAYPNGFDLQVCNEGSPHTPEELQGISLWRSAAQ